MAGIYRKGALFWADLGKLPSQSLKALRDSSVVQVPVASARSQEAISIDPLDREVVNWRDRRHLTLMRWGFMLARSTSVEKLSFFLLELMDGLPVGVPMNLLLTRDEIGDHLGLTSETVTRTITLLQHEGLISAHGKWVTIIDRDGLMGRAAQIYST